MKRVLVSALLAMAFAASPAQAQDRWERVVRQELQRVGSNSEGRGYRMSHDIHQGRLDDDANTFLTLNLESGKDYEIWGVCDQDCSDIDMVLYDENDNEIDSDLLVDDKPVVEVIPRRTGRFRIKVMMATCTANPCRFGVGVWSKNASAGDRADNDRNNAVPTPSASGEDQWESVVRSQFRSVASELESRGFSMSHEVFMGRLDDDENESLNIPLDGGNEYVLLGRCDQDCTDLDLTIFDADGNEVDTDLDVDDRPQLQLTVRRDARYRVRVSMATCSANPCRYGVGVWAK